MSEFKNKNDYSCTIFSESGFLVKVEFVHSILSLAKWLDNSKYKEWNYINVYARRSQRYILRHYKGNFINQFPK